MSVAFPGAHGVPVTDSLTKSRAAVAAARYDFLSTEIGIVLVALFYGICAFAVTTFVRSANEAPQRRPFGMAQLGQMLVCIACAAIGAFAQARGLTPERLLVTAVAVSALAGAAQDPRFRSRLSIYALGAALIAVLLSAAFDSMWSAVVSALVLALPFLVTTFFVRERAASACDALLAALAGATIGITGAVLVLFIAGLSALATGALRKQAGSHRTLAAFTAALTLAAIFYNFSFGS